MKRARFDIARDQNAERFFKAHRLLARHAVEHGPGFWIRFTVHYNLCFGTVLAVGGDEQVAWRIYHEFQQSLNAQELALGWERSSKSVTFG